MDMVITFYGFTKAKVIESMPTLVQTLALGHPRYSVKVEEEPLLVFDKNGRQVKMDLLRDDRNPGIVISIPGYEKVRNDLEATIGALQDALGVAVTTDSATPSVVADTDIITL